MDNRITFCFTAENKVWLPFCRQFVNYTEHSIVLGVPNTRHVLRLFPAHPPPHALQCEAGSAHQLDSQEVSTIDSAKRSVYSIFL